MTTGQKLIVVMLAAILVVALIAMIVILGANRNEKAEPTEIALIDTPIPWTSTPTQIFIPPTWTMEPSPTWRSTDTPTPLPSDTPIPPATATFVPTFTPRPTNTPTPTLPKVENGTFDRVSNFAIPGWSWWAMDNWSPESGGYDPATSYETPLIKSADDPARLISGPTLQIDAASYVRFKVHIYQTVEADPGLNVRFQAMAGGWAPENGGIMVMAGIDRHGNDGCQTAQWGEMRRVDPANSPIFLLSPDVVVGEEGQVTVCLYAEPQYALVKNAAFFDDAEIVVIE